VRSGEGPVGLWVYGDGRCQGTTTIGQVALARMEWDEHDTDEAVCLDLLDTIRRSWGAGEMSRHLPNDYDLYVDANVLDMQIERYWDVDVLMLDDFHKESIDMAFWRRHVQPRIERRLKARKPTIITTDMPPSSPTLEGLQRVITTMFVTCYAER
jgi:hypothetical protein